MSKRQGGARRMLGALGRALGRPLKPHAAPAPPKPRRLELAWTAADRQAIRDTALDAAPREGAVLALCRRSTGATRDTFLVLEPLLPQQGDLSYRRGLVVTLTSRYWNRAIDRLQEEPAGTGVAVLHTHPGRGIPVWSDDDDQADTALAEFLYGQGFLPMAAPLLSLVATETDLRGRALTLAPDSRVRMRPIERVRTVSPVRITIDSTADCSGSGGHMPVPTAADRAIRAFGRDGQRRLADLHVAAVGAGGVGSIVGEHLVRWGVGTVSVWDPDIIKDVNINRSAIYTFAHAADERLKAEVMADVLPTMSLHRGLRAHGRAVDVRRREQLPALLDADLIVLLVDDARPRHFINGEFLLMELEVVEPDLFLDHSPTAAATLAEAIERRAGSPRTSEAAERIG